MNRFLYQVILFFAPKADAEASIWQQLGDVGSGGKHGKEIGKQDRREKAALKGALLNWGQLELDPTGEITGTSV